MQNIDDTITIEVKGRLNDLFGETVDESGEFLGDQPQDDSPLKDLKSAVLSIDWEITEEVMNDFMAQVNLLTRRFKGDRIILLFLQLLGSVGKYIQVRGARSHPESFKILNTVFNRLDEVVNLPELTESQKKRYLYAEIVRFKQLREKIASEHSGASQKPETDAETAGPPAHAPLPKAPQVKTPPPKAPPVKTPLPKAPPQKDMPAAAKGAKMAPKAEPESPVEPSAQERSARDGQAPEKEGAAFGAVFPKNQERDASSPDGEPVPPLPDNIHDALEEIKLLIREEFDSLRVQLRLLSRRR